MIRRGGELANILVQALFLLIEGTYTGMSKKREPMVSYEISPNFGPINLKMCMNNLNTHGFQHIRYKILNLNTF